MAIIKTIRIYDTAGISKAQDYIENPEKTTRKSSYDHNNHINSSGSEWTDSVIFRQSGDIANKDWNVQHADPDISRELHYDMNFSKPSLPWQRNSFTFWKSHWI